MKFLLNCLFYQLTSKTFTYVHKLAMLCSIIKKALADNKQGLVKNK